MFKQLLAAEGFKVPFLYRKLELERESQNILSWKGPMRIKIQLLDKTDTFCCEGSGGFSASDFRQKVKGDILTFFCNITKNSTSREFPLKARAGNLKSELCTQTQNKHSLSWFLFYSWKRGSEISPGCFETGLQSGEGHPPGLGGSAALGGCLGAPPLL